MSIANKPVTFMAYGSFTEPTTGLNFVVCRMPAGRVPWAKKLIPALDKILRPWLPASARSARARSGHWDIDGTDGDLWELKTRPLRFEWDGARWKSVPREG